MDTARKTDNKHQYLTVIVLASFLAVIISLFLLSRSSIETADYTERVKSKALLERAFDHELHTINQTLLDYAFWDDAVRQILINENDAWLAENFEHTYLQNNFGFNVVGLLDDMDEPKFLYLDGVEISQFKESQAFQAFSVLAHHARTAFQESIAPTSGVVSIRDQLYLAGAVPLYSDKPDLMEQIQDHPLVLVFARRIDQAFLNDLAYRYQIEKPSVLALEASGFLRQDSNLQTLPLKSPHGNDVAVLVWGVPLPGEQIASNLTRYGVLTALVILAIFIFFGYRTRNLLTNFQSVRKELQDADLSVGSLRDELQQITGQTDVQIVRLDGYGQTLESIGRGQLKIFTTTHLGDKHFPDCLHAGREQVTDLISQCRLDGHAEGCFQHNGRSYEFTFDLVESGEQVSGFMTGIIQDISDRDSAQKARELEAVNRGLHLSEEKLTRILATAADAIITIDEKGVITSFNRYAEHLFGYAEDEVIGKKINMLMPPEVAKHHDGFIASYMTTRHPKVIGSGRDVEALKRDGTVFPVHLSISETRLEHTSIFTGILRDMSEERKLEEELRTAKEQAESANHAKSAFLATMSHEIRTPMNGVIGMIDLLRETKLNDDQRFMVDTIHESSFSLLGIINQILDFSKIEAGKLEIEEIPTSIRDIMENTGETLAPNALKKGVALTVHIDPHMPDKILGDPVRLRQILFNLAGNAIKFTESDVGRPGQVQLRADYVGATENGPKALRFTIKDNGLGMDEATRERVFKPFSQADETIARNYGGTGLGLSITRSLVDMMSGELSVESTAGAGTTFTVSLPIRPCRQSHLDMVEPDIAGLDILVVGDYPFERHTLLEYLDHYGAHHEAMTFEQVVTYLEETHKKGHMPDVVLLEERESEQSQDQISRLRKLQRDHKPRFLLLSTQRKGRQGTLDQDSYRIYCQPMRRSQLLLGLAILVGRASPLVDHSTLSLRAPTETEEQPIESDVSILVAEDNPTNQEVIRRQLALLGYNCTIAEDGIEALHRYHRQPFDLLLTDCHMPEMDGFELTRSIRHAEEGSKNHLPILAITANALQGEAERCIAAGMDDYMAKPVEMPLLKSKLKHWLATTTPSGEPQPSPVAEPGPEVEVEVEVEVDPAAPYDRDVLGKLIGNDPTAIDEVLRDFVAPTQAILDDLRRANADADRKAIKDQAHKLKSSSRSIGSTTLADLCAELETRAASDDHDDIGPLVSEVDALANTVIDAIQNDLGSPRAIASGE